MICKKKKNLTVIYIFPPWSPLLQIDNVHISGGGSETEMSAKLVLT
jgi:hypothetical protein